MRVETMAVTRRPFLVGSLGVVGVVVVALLLSGLFGIARAIQLVVTLVVPGLVMTGFWLVARERILARESEFDTALEIETLTNRAAFGFLADVCHELRPHLERCSLRAEALAVAVDYRDVRPDLKVAVSDTVVLTDPVVLRQVLHILVGNAIRRGSDRVALWASDDDGKVRLSVSDDGPGLPIEIGTRVFDRYLDLGERGRATRPVAESLPLARILAELIGGRMVYKKDRTWTHFSVVLPAGLGGSPASNDRVPIDAGVH
jgi:signal transduction histidine kinase